MRDALRVMQEMRALGVEEEGFRLIPFPSRPLPEPIPDGAMKLRRASRE